MGNLIIRKDDLARTVRSRFLSQPARAIAWLAVAVVFAISLLDLVGWGFGIAPLKSIRPGWASMSPATAVCLALCALELTFLQLRPRRPHQWTLLQVPGLAVGVVGALMISLYAAAGIVGWHPALGPHRLFSLIWAPPTRMSLLSALIFLVTGSALTLLVRGGRRAAGIAHAVMVPAVTVSYLVPISYLLGVQGVYALLGIQIAFHTGIAFCALGIAIFCARPETWLTSVFSGETAGSMMARRLLPAIVAIPLLIAWLRLYGERSRRFGSEVGVVLVALAYTLCLLALVGLTAASLNRADRRRRQAEAKLSESGRRLEQTQELLEAVTAGTEVIIATVDLDLRYTFFNRTYEEEIKRLAGKHVEAGASLIETFAHMPEQQAIAVREWQQALGGETSTRIIKFGDPSRYQRAYRVHHTPILDAQGRVIGAGEIAYDVTEQQRADEVLKRDKETLEKLVGERSQQLLDAQMALEKSRRLSDIGMLSATVAHELRNPLAAMKLAAFNIKRKAKDSALASHLRTIEKKIMESDQIINNLLFFSRIRTPDMEPVDVSLVLGECLEVNARQTEKRVAVKKDLTRIRGTMIEVDQLQLREVLQNILNNAYDAVPNEGGTIEIVATDEGDAIGLRFTDNGSGIAAEDLAKVFDPFFTTKAKGTGLGLSVCRQMVDMHGGTISIASQPGDGTTVTVRLPKRSARTKSSAQ